jgi:hypothetical protein
MRTLHEYQTTFVIVCRYILLRMRNASDKRCTESGNEYFLFNKFCSENRSFNEIMWKKYCSTGQTTDDNVLRYMRIVCWVANATDTDSVYITIIASPR